MVPLVILPMVQLVANGTIGFQWYHWLTNGTIGLPMLPLAYQWYQCYHWLTNGTNCTTGRANGTIGKTLNDFGMPLVPLGNPEHTLSQLSRVNIPSKDTSPFNPMGEITVDPKGAVKLLNNLKIHTACDPGGLSDRVLKECSTEIAPILNLQ